MSKVEEIKKKPPISKISLSTTKGLIKAWIPVTSKILKTFEPKIFPRAI